MDITNSKTFNIRKQENVSKQNALKQASSNSSDIKFTDELKKVKEDEIRQDINTSINEEKNVVKDKTLTEEGLPKDNVKDTDLKEEEFDKKEKFNNKEKFDNEEKITDFNEKEKFNNKGKFDNKEKIIDFNEKEKLYQSISQDKNIQDNKNSQIDCAINGLNDILGELNLHNSETVALNQKDELSEEVIKPKELYTDNNDKQEDFNLIDNNINIQEPQDKFNNMQMGASMEFNSNGQPFAEFVNQDKNKNSLKSTQKDIAEEKAILSTMEENIAIANKNMAMSKTRTIENEHGIQKIDKKSNLIVDTIVSYDSVVMDKSDVEFFTNLVENGVVDIKEVQSSEKSSRVSKALADLLAKAMNDNKPIRIDFDNNISVIIKIDRAGKISADFLPSSQVAEAYLKENLPLLRQRFDDNNIDYNELNQRQRKQDTQDNRKKGRKDE